VFHVPSAHPSTRSQFPFAPCRLSLVVIDKKNGQRRHRFSPITGRRREEFTSRPRGTAIARNLSLASASPYFYYTTSARSGVNRVFFSSPSDDATVAQYDDTWCAQTAIQSVRRDDRDDVSASDGTIIAAYRLPSFLSGWTDITDTRRNGEYRLKRLWLSTAIAAQGLIIWPAILQKLKSSEMSH